MKTESSAAAALGKLAANGYQVRAIVEHEERKRLSTVRLLSQTGVMVDLLAASCGIEAEITARATSIDIGEDVGSVPVATAEDLLAMKVLSMRSARPQDFIDAVNLVQTSPTIDLGQVRAALATITDRGF